MKMQTCTMKSFTRALPTRALLTHATKTTAGLGSALACAMILLTCAAMLSGCEISGQHDPILPPPPPAPKPGPKDVTKNYVQSGTLNLIATNQELAVVKSNWLAIDGFGTKSTYNFHYTFNSGPNNTFQLLSLERKTKARGGCKNVPETSATLSSKYGVATLDVVTKASLIPDTDYTLDLSIGATGCLDLDVAQNVIAWAAAGGRAAEPRLAALCTAPLAEAAFLPGYNVMTVLVAGQKEPFIDPHHYCGNRLETVRRVQCDSTISGSPMAGVVRCQAQTDSASFGSEVQLIAGTSATAKKATAKISCTKNGTKIATEEFANCRGLVLDLTQFGQFE